MAKSLNEFTEFIRKETANARREIPHWLQDPRVSSVGCVDPFTQKGIENVPGGMAAIDRYGHTDKFMAARHGQSVIVYVHEHCGDLYINEGLTTLEAQQARLDALEASLYDSAQHHNVSLTIVREPQGSAAPYMSD